jgi:hypothetical protein
MINMSTIFIDMRTKEEFLRNPRKGAINIPLLELLFDDIKALEFLPWNTVIEYYHPLGNLAEYVKHVLYKRYGLRNVNNLGDIRAISSEVCIFDNNNENKRYYTDQ